MIKWINLRTIWFFLLAGSSRSHRTFYNEEIEESHYFTAFSRSSGFGWSWGWVSDFRTKSSRISATSIKLQFYVIIWIFLMKFFYFFCFSHNLKSKNNGIMLFCRAVVSSFLEGIFSSEGVLKGESENDLDSTADRSCQALKCKISPECWQGCRDQCQKWHFYNDFWMLLFEGK